MRGHNRITIVWMASASMTMRMVRRAACLAVAWASMQSRNSQSSPVTIRLSTVRRREEWLTRLPDRGQISFTAAGTNSSATASWTPRTTSMWAASRLSNAISLAGRSAVQFRGMEHSSSRITKASDRAWESQPLQPYRRTWPEPAPCKPWTHLRALPTGEFSTPEYAN